MYTNGQKTVNASGYYISSVSSNEIIGNIQPDWVGGINNRLTFTLLPLVSLIDVKQGGDLFNLDLYYGLATGLYERNCCTQRPRKRSAQSSQRGWWSPLCRVCWLTGHQIPNIITQPTLVFMDIEEIRMQHLYMMPATLSLER